MLDFELLCTYVRLQLDTCARDWLSPITRVFHLFETDNREEYERVRRTLLTLFVVKAGLDTDWDVDELVSLKKENLRFIITALYGVVINRLVIWYGAGQQTWDGDESCAGVDGDNDKLLNNNQVQIEEFHGLHFVLLKYLISLKREGIPLLYTKALFFIEHDGIRLSRYTHNIIRVCDVVDVTIDTSKSSARVLEPTNDGTSDIKFLPICGTGSSILSHL